MVDVFVGIGSNVDAEQNIRKALHLLGKQFGKLSVSPAYQSRAIGFDGDDFINLAVRFKSAMPAAGIYQTLAEIEITCGRTRETRRFGPRTLDLDLLLFGDETLQCNGVAIPRPEILKYAFVLRPLSDIAADRHHPGSGKSFGALWQAFADSNQATQRLEIEFS